MIRYDYEPLVEVACAALLLFCYWRVSRWAAVLVARNSLGSGPSKKTPIPPSQTLTKPLDLARENKKTLVFDYEVSCHCQDLQARKARREAAAVSEGCKSPADILEV